MLELLWVKSLLYFFLLGLCLLFLIFLRRKMKYQEAKMLLLPVGILVASQLFSFVYFTPWLKALVSVSVLRFDSVLQFMLGPAVVHSLLSVRGARGVGVMHFIPAVVVALTIIIIPESVVIRDLSFLLLQVHIMLYMMWGLRIISGIKLKSVEIEDSFKLFFWLVIGANVLHFVDFVLWRYLLVVGEGFATFLFIAAELTWISGVVRLFYVMIAYRLTWEETTAVPGSVAQRLQNELDSYLAQPEVFTDPLISLRKIADYFRVDPHHVSKFLNGKKGESLTQIIHRNRLAYCKEMLEGQDDRSIQEIFYAAGFSSKSVYNTAFKKETGYTPSEYRRVVGLRGRQVGKRKHWRLVGDNTNKGEDDSYE